MTNATRSPQSKFSAKFQRNSIKTKATISTLAIFLIGIWSLALYASFMLHIDMEKGLGNQQFSTVSIIAAEINTGLDERIRALENVAALITPAMLGNAAAMQRFIEGRPILPMMFNGGFFVLLPDGTAIADYPLSTGRRGLNFMDRKYAMGALQEGKSTIGNPVMGKALRSTLFSIAVPIHNAKGKVIGALAGTVDLARPNFISRITDNTYGETGGYLLVAPEVRTIVYATDKKRILEVLPAPGINPFIDRAIKGWEGSGVAVTPFGMEVLASVKGIPLSGWYISGLIPTDEAFAPIRAMKLRLLLAAIFLTLLAGFLSWWMLKSQLEPVLKTIKTLVALSDTDQDPQPLPIIRQDEIGELIGGFNRLLATLRKRSEELQESEKKHRLLIENSHDIIYTLTADGVFTFVSPAWTVLLGHPVTSVAGQSFQIFVHPDDISECMVWLQKVIETGQRQEGVEYRVRHLNGSWLWHTSSAVPLKDETGRTIGFEGTARDINDRKQVEADREILDATNLQLQKTESLSRMAGSIAHYFNNKLGVVIGNLEMALLEIHEGDSLHESISSAMEASNKAAEMSGLMLTYLGQSFEKREPLDLSYSCRKILPILKTTMPENVILEIDFSSPGPVINTNTDYIQQIFTNLFTNAREAIGKDSGTIFLSVKTVSPSEIPTKNRFPIDWQPLNSAYACLEVADTGGGIADKDMEKLFDPFFTNKFTGRGMGLSVVLGIVKNHKGVISVESKPKPGSTFRVFFPLSEVALSQPQNAANKDDAMISAVSPIKFEEGGTVLLIEDEEKLRNMTATMLKRLGFAVLEAKDGVEALEVFGQRRKEIKFVLSDLTMPRMDGWETLTALRKLQPDITVILSSGYDKAHVMAGDHPETPQAFLGKPYMLRELSEAISQALEREKR